MTKAVSYGGFEGDLEKTNCPTCGKTAGSTLLFKEGEIRFYRCDNCNLQFASPRFTETTMLKIYEAENFTNDYREFQEWSYDNWKLKGDRSYTVSLEKVRLIQEYLHEDARILDVGCSVGLTVLLARENGFDAQGIEPSKELYSIAVKNIGIPVKNMQIQELRDEPPFDGVIIWDVLEHLYNPVEVLKSCSSNLKQGGYLFAQIPNHHGVGNKVKEWLCRVGIRKTFKHFGFPWHVYSFDKKSLAIMLEKADLEAERFESWPSALMDAKTDPFSKLNIYLAKRFALTDYITVVAKKIR